MLKLSERHYRDVLEPRGISSHIAEGGRYGSYTPADLDELHERFDFGAAQTRASRTRTVRGGSGLVIARHGWHRAEWLNGKLAEIEQPVSQLRPDERPTEGRRYINLGGDAKGLDFHPIAVEHLRKSIEKSTAWFALEGTFKADAGLSIGWQTFNVPSVTLWDSRDFRTVGPRLAGCPILFVVTDSDWSTNPDVSLQAQLCVEKLRGLGIPALHVAPRDLCEVEHVHDKTCKTGLDDIIASESWTPLTDMLVVPLLPQFVPQTLSSSGRLLFSCLLAKHRHVVSAYPGQIRRETGLKPGQLRWARDELENAGLLVVEHGASRWDSDAGRWRPRPSVYTFRTEPVALSELGWTHPDQLERIPRITKGMRKTLDELARRSLDVGTPPEIERTCEQCGRSMAGRRRGARFCGDRCRRAWTRRPAEVFRMRPEADSIISTFIEEERKRMRSDG